MVHSLKAGSSIGLRGPLETLSLRPSHYDRIVMVSLIVFSKRNDLKPDIQISTGTGVAPFLQLLNTIQPGPSTPELHLIHSLSRTLETDFIASPSIIPDRAGVDVTLHRSEPGLVPTALLKEALEPRQQGKSVLVLVCLPQK